MVATQRMADEDSVITGFIEQAIGFVSELKAWNRLTGFKPKRFLAHKIPVAHNSNFSNSGVSRYIARIVHSKENMRIHEGEFNCLFESSRGSLTIRTSHNPWERFI